MKLISLVFFFERFRYFIYLNLAFTIAIKFLPNQIAVFLLFFYSVLPNPYTLFQQSPFLSLEILKPVIII